MNSAKELPHFIKVNNRGKLSAVLKRATAIGAYHTSSNTYAHRALYFTQKQCFTPKMRRETVLLHSAVEMAEVMEALGRGEDPSKFYSELGCGSYSRHGKRLVHRYEYLNQNIVLAMLERRIIFIIFDFEDYGVEQINDKNEYVAHSTCAIFVPKQNEPSGYECYYINSHGQDMKHTDSFEVILSSKRVRTYNYEAIADVVFMKGYIKYLEKFSLKFVGEACRIGYDGSSGHTYLGTDLQAGDTHGLCFVYPLIIWYYFGKYYSATRSIETETGLVKMPKGCTLLKNGHLGEFVEACFLDFCPEYAAQSFYRKKGYNRRAAIDSFQRVIENQSTYFTKILARAVVSFMAQSFFKKNIAA